MLLEMEFCSRHTGSSSMWLIFVIVFSSAKARTVIEGDILTDDEAVVQTMAYTAVPVTDTWTLGHIPYHLDRSLDQRGDIFTNITAAMANIESKTNNCVRFFVRTYSYRDYINITGFRSGCYSSVGRKGGKQELNIGLGCEDVGIIMHELLHALGFWHEHSRFDRDDYVKINKENIFQDKISNFDKRKEPSDYESVIPYDFRSILHYKYNEFAKSPRLATIEPNAIHSYVNKTELGQRKRLSDYDIDRILWLYSCDGSIKSSLTPDLSCAPPDFVFVKVSPVQNRYMIGLAVKFACNTGTLIGAKQSVCMPDGSWSGAKPYCVKGNVNPFVYCDMENCLKSRQGQWKEQCGPAPPPGTGPNNDHTTQNRYGIYLYLEAGETGAQTANIYSPYLSSNSPICLMFYYYMYGGDLETSNLSVYIGQRYWKKFFSKVGSTKNQEWYKAFITTKINHGFVKISATLARGCKSGIAIDDVFFGPCDEVKTYNDVIEQEESKAQEYD